MIQKGIYRHFKGKEYEVLGTAIHSETLEEMVIYKPLYESSDLPKDILWVRPMKMFTENVMHQGKEVQRFQKI
jgi:hypothetical protein